MNKQEEEAIKALKLFEYKYTLRNNDDKKIETILNLIDKQQKELKRLDRENQHLFEDLFENYIPKEAIKELLKIQENYGGFLNGLRDLLGDK